MNDNLNNERKILKDSYNEKYFSDLELLHQELGLKALVNTAFQQMVEDKVKTLEMGWCNLPGLLARIQLQVDYCYSLSIELNRIQDKKYLAGFTEINSIEEYEKKRFSIQPRSQEDLDFIKNTTEAFFDDMGTFVSPDEVKQ